MAVDAVLVPTRQVDVAAEVLIASHLRIANAELASAHQLSTTGHRDVVYLSYRLSITAQITGRGTLHRPVHNLELENVRDTWSTAIGMSESCAMQGSMDGDLKQLGERIAEQAAHLDAAMYRFLTDLREFDERGGWHVQGASSCAHWLTWRVGWDLVTGRERVRVARKLAEFPVIGDALRRGEISYSKVRALMRVATTENEVLLLDHARLMTASQLEKLSHKYALVQRHCQDPHPLADVQRRCVRRRDMEDGMVKIEAILHPEEAELVWTMINHAATQLAHETARPVSDDSAESRVVAQTHGVAVMPLLRDTAACGCDDSAESREPLADLGAKPTASSGDLEASETCDVCDNDSSAKSCEVTKPTARREPSVLHQRADAARRAFNRADALVSVAEGYLRGDRPHRSPVEITLTIPESGLRAPTGMADSSKVGEMGDSFVSAEAARRLSCDAGVVEIVEGDDGTLLSVGRKRRTFAGALKRALHRRDVTCTYPGCTHRIFLEGHHIKHWADGGETSLQNTALLCSLHHRYVHEYRYTIELGDDQRPRFRDPHGRLVAAVPNRPAVPELGWPWIRAVNEPLAIDADTIACEWDGRPVDYGAIVGHLVGVDGLGNGESGSRKTGESRR